MVENVEEFSPKAQAYLLCEMKYSLKCNICLPGSEAPQDIAS